MQRSYDRVLLRVVRGRSVVFDLGADLARMVRCRDASLVAITGSHYCRQDCRLQISRVENRHVASPKQARYLKAKGVTFLICVK